MAKDLKWYWNRLQAMSPAEVASRGKLAAKKKLWQQRSTWTAPKPRCRYNYLWKFPDLDFKAQYPEDYQAIIDEAEGYLRGSYRLLNVDFEEEKIDWHRDPVSKIKAPIKFGPDINYRDFNLVGNVKNIWEKSRHHHLTVLALAYALTGNEAYSSLVADQLNDWIKENPFPIGINWSSALEFGVRLISWVWIERLLRPSACHEQLFGTAGTLWESIYWHQWIISQYYSPGSSANNHLIGEMAGLFMASCQWPVFQESPQWRALSKQSLEQEIHKQTFASGLNREQAFSYHIFSLEFFLLAGMEGDRCGDDFSMSYKATVKQMFEVIPQVCDFGGNLPQYGDGDDGMALQLRPTSSSRTAWLYQLGRQWLGANVPDEKASGILAAPIIGSGLMDRSASASPLSCKSVAFDDAGLYVLASNRNSAKEIFCLADAGPLGFLSIAAHGHADALAFTLSVGGVPVIVDAGTYIYHADLARREYFKSTKAHNTIEIDGKNQSESAGIFLWTQKANCKVSMWQPSEAGGTVVAEHDGYTKLEGAVIHQRKIFLDGDRLELQDNLKGTGAHAIEWRLHFAPQCDVRIDDGVCLVQWVNGSLKIKLDGRLEYSILKGAEDGGWFSAGFNLREPAYTLVGRANMQVPVCLENRVEVYHEN